MTRGAWLLLAFLLVASAVLAFRWLGWPVWAGPTPVGPTPAPASACQYVREALPDPHCTPGASDPRVTQSNIAETICVRGYTARVRPPVAYTDRLKREQLVQYGQDPSQAPAYEEDHLEPLELGGDPSSPANLWPEPLESARRKDEVENQLHAAVCSGRISLTEAQERIRRDWTTAPEGIPS